MCKCKFCENLLDEEIKVVDFTTGPFGDEFYHWEQGFRCTYNGSEALDMEGLQKNGCRCIGGEQ
ncbi:MAG: hypothetical protein IJH65_13835 [Methanobrevibacter sp.]|nr:hypothetical protein [Methanobrevibacter sp.]